MRSRRAACQSIGVCLAGMALSLALPAAAPAATTIGSNLIQPANASLICGGGCTGSFSVLPAGATAAGGLTAPTSGVIVRWRIKRGAATATSRLQVLTPGLAVSRAATAESAIESPPINATTTYDTRLPIQAGDGIGVSTTNVPQSTTAGATARNFTPALVVGGAAASGSTQSPREPLINADIEPDADGDGFGDETQDQCPSNAAAQGPCPRTLTVITEEGGTVTGPGIDCPGDCTEVYPHGTLVDLTVTAAKGFGNSGFAAGDCFSGTPGLKVATCRVAMFGDRSVNAGFGDIASPDTFITKKPKKKSSKRKIRIKFRSSEPGSTFQCALDKKKFKRGKRCRSPFRAKVKPGKHVFMVRAIDPGGLVDTKPAKVKFEVFGGRPG